MRGTLNFSIRNLKSGKASIQVIHIFGRGNEVRYATGKFLKQPQNWNEKKQRCKNLTAEPIARKLNKYLDKITVQLVKELEDLSFEKSDYTKSDVKKVFDDIFKKTKSSIKSNPSLLECYDWYIEHFSINPNPTTRKPLSNGTIRSFKTSLKIFKRYSKISGPIDYEDISIEWYHAFVNYLQEENYSNNYIANHIKNLKTVMNYSFTRGYHKNVAHKSREFAKPSEMVDAIYLNPEELKAIEKLDLPNGLGVSRDLFLIGAHTGLRVSDFSRLKKENLEFIQGKYYFKVIVKKTAQSVLIPCHPVTIKIIEKYGFAPPPKKPHQHINRDLKIIGAKAKINEEVLITKTIGGKKSTEKYKKFDLLSSHTGRRSFCTNAYMAGMPTRDIMSISGHQTERVFYLYIKASSLEKAQRIAEHPFFNS